MAWWFALDASASARSARAEKSVADAQRDRANTEANDAETQRRLAVGAKEKAQRSLAVSQLLRAGLIFETEPEAALALLHDREAIPVEWRDPAWGFFNSYCRRKIRGIIRGHSAWIHAVAWSPDGKTLASAGHDNTIKPSASISLGSVGGPP
jgi:hypothetical protein